MMRMNRFVLVIMITIPLALRGEISLSECQERAQEHYPIIKTYDLLEKSAGYDVSNAAKGYLPQVSAYGQASLQNRVATYPDVLTKMMSQSGLNVRGINKDQYKVGAEVNQNI